MATAYQEQSIIWRRLDMPGHEWAESVVDENEERLYGTTIFVYEHKPCCLEYLIECDANGQTVAATVTGSVGDNIIELDITVDAERNWFVNGEKNLSVAGCIDIDLNFSPSTNTLPIRRLNLSIGQNARVRSAWLRFPGFDFETLEQTYTRIDETHYRYESASGFMRDLEVNEFGFVTDYPDFWQMEKG